MGGRHAKVHKPDKYLYISRFFDGLAHNRLLGAVVDKMDDNGAYMSFPYHEKFVGDPQSKVIHGGAITALMDACSGVAVYVALENIRPIATLDLRIDYFRPAKPGDSIRAHAVCHTLTKNVAFVSCRAFQSSGNVCIAEATSTFAVMNG